MRVLLYLTDITRLIADFVAARCLSLTVIRQAAAMGRWALFLFFNLRI